jgi:hypothetical protein
MARDAIKEFKTASAFGATQAARSADIPRAIDDSRAATAQRRLASLADNGTKHDE